MTQIFELTGKACGCGLVTASCLTLATSWTVAYQTPLFMRFPRQEFWSGLPFPSPIIELKVIWNDELWNQFTSKRKDQQIKGMSMKKKYKLSILHQFLVTQIFIISHFFLLPYPFSFLLSAGDFGWYILVSVWSYLPPKSVEIDFGKQLNYWKVAHFSLMKPGFWAQLRCARFSFSLFAQEWPF